MGHLQGHSVPHDDAGEPSADTSRPPLQKRPDLGRVPVGDQVGVFSCRSRRPRRCLSSSQRPWCQAKLRIGHGPGPPRAQGRAQVRIPRGNAGLRGRGCTPYKGFVRGFRIVMRRWLNPVLGVVPLATERRLRWHIQAKFRKTPRMRFLCKQEQYPLIKDKGHERSRRIDGRE